jgi:hypothetical protein
MEPKRILSLSKTPKAKMNKKLDISAIEGLPAINEKEKLFHENISLRTEIKRLKSDMIHFKAEANRANMDLEKKDKQIQDFMEKEKLVESNKNVSFNANVTNSPDVAARLREVYYN